MIRRYGYSRPNSYATRILPEYSSRGWVYHLDQGWMFDELTSDELAILKADYAPTIPTIRFPKGTVVSFHQPSLDFENWFAYCILTDLHALAFSLIHHGTTCIQIIWLRFIIRPLHSGGFLLTM